MDADKTIAAACPLRRGVAPRGTPLTGSRPSAAAAFTLVEVLVVIGILAALLGLLLPALAAARGAAQQATCASNLRQIVAAALAYGQANRGYWPPAHVDLLTKNLRRWHGTRTSTAAPFQFSQDAPLVPYLQDGQVKECPTFEREKAGFEAASGGYGYNNHYLGSSQAEPALASLALGPAEWDRRVGNVPARMAAVLRPAQKVAFADAAMATPELIEYSFLEPPTTAWGPTSPSIHFRHGEQRASVAWADGHVTAEHFKWTYPSNAYGADNAAKRLGFFGGKNNATFQRR